VSLPRSVRDQTLAEVVLEWDAVDWRPHEDNVGRLRKRIFKAAQDGDLAQSEPPSRLA
jgi:hypothetical protein